jgi:hypothetical protein
VTVAEATVAETAVAETAVAHREPAASETATAKAVTSETATAKAVTSAAKTTTMASAATTASTAAPCERGCAGRRCRYAEHDGRSYCNHLLAHFSKLLKFLPCDDWRFMTLSHGVGYPIALSMRPAFRASVSFENIAARFQNRAIALRL